MTRLAPRLARGCCAALLLLSGTPLVACSKLTTVTTPEFPLSVSAKPPALPLPELDPVPQPPPPPRVTLAEDDTLTLDEALSFDEAGALSAEHADILAELAKWLAQHEEVSVLNVEAQIVAKGGKRKLEQLSEARAQRVVDALVAAGIAAERLAAVGLGKPEGEQPPQLILRVAERAESEDMVMTPE